MNLASLLRLLTLAAIWGGSFLFMRIVVPALGAVPTAFGRVVLSSAGLLALIGLMRVPLAFHGKFRSTLLLGAVNSGMPFLLFSLAARVLPAGYSAILNATAPLMGVVIGALGFHEQLTVAKASSVLIGLVGVAVLAQAGPVTPDAALVLGVGLCLAATACYGLATYLTRRWISERGGLDSRITALGSQLGAVLSLLPFAVWNLASRPPAWSEVSGQAWLALVALGLVCTSVAYILYFRLIADLGPLKALTVTFLIPAFGVLWGWAFLGEPVGLAHLAGGGLIGVALWLVLRPAR
ncbi:DMT family transporter [Pelomonas sp. KK5]|uniref:DMT family transporter n=1 Tax=Pelomonas sp. KK5 TaxID=1855730 RepID=UPI00097BE8F6|nr:DMT family transporter [Pelomonas sp. KK5]